jgi:hypothetical protein
MSIKVTDSAYGEIVKALGASGKEVKKDVRVFVKGIG